MKKKIEKKNVIDQYVKNQNLDQILCPDMVEIKDEESKMITFCRLRIFISIKSQWFNFGGNFKNTKKKPNASICDFCYNDTPDDNGKFYI